MEARLKTLELHRDVTVEACALLDADSKPIACTALTEAQRCLAAHERTSLALRALVGELARTRARGGALEKEQARGAAERRYTEEQKENGASPAEAARLALQ